MQTSKDIVQARYPDARARFHDAVFEMGHASPKWDAYWSISIPMGRALATGPTESAAWVNTEAVVIEEYKQNMTGAFVIAKHTLMDAVGQGGEAKEAVLQVISETLQSGKVAYVVKDDGALSILKFDRDGNMISEPLDAIWSRAAEICEKEVGLADSSRSQWGQPMPGHSQEKADAEHDEFLARSVVFNRIGRICRIIDPNFVAERIRALTDEPELTNSDIKNRDVFSAQWRPAYEYALDQCGIRPYI